MVRKSIFTGLVVCLCVLVPTVYSQTQTLTQNSTQSAGTFTGHLSGAGMDGATVTFTNSTTGAAQSATTDSSGGFTFNNLAPGTYRVSVHTKSGLQLGESSIEISPSNTNQVQVNFASTPAAPAAKLELDEPTPTVQTNSAEVSRSYDSQVIRSLPVLDRQNQELISLMPGVTPPAIAGDRITDPQQTRSFNVNGLPAYANLHNQDGAYGNEPFRGLPSRILPDEAVQALEVRTSNYNAEYGLSGGSWSSTLTRPGTNAIHGSLFEFNTNSFFRNGRQLEATTQSPRFNENQFGGTAGGAVLPDRMFWFISYEGRIQRGNQEAEATVPMAGLSSGNFSSFPGTALYNPGSGSTTGTGRSIFTGNVIPQSQLNPAAQQILSLVPAANRPGFYNNLVGSVPLRDDNHRIDAKLDHRFSEKSTGFFRYGFTQDSVDQGSILGLAGSPLNAELRGINAVGSYTHVFSTNFLAEARFGYDRYRNQISPWGSFPTTGLAAFPNGLPSINIAGFSSLGFAADVPRKEISNTYDGALSMSYRSGMHALRFGIGIRELEANGFANPYFSPLGSFVFGPGATLGNTASSVNLGPALLQVNALAGFLTGSPSMAGVASYTTTPAYRQMQYSAYLTDTVNLMKRLYLELGVRYDIFDPIEPSRAGGAVVYDPTTNTVNSLGVNGSSIRSYRTDLNNVAPRVGLAFRATERFVFRAGYGIHYFALPFAMMPFNPATVGTQSGIAGGLGTTAFTIPAVTTPLGTTAPNLPFLVSGRNQNTPYVQTYSGMLQGDLGNGFLLDIGYVGNVGRQLPYFVSDTGQPGTGLAGLPIAGRTALNTTFGTGLNSNFNSLQVNLTKKFAAGLAITGAYTYGKALDYGTYLADPFSRAANYGPADWDRTHILTVSHDWRLPFGVRQKYFTSGWAARMLGDWELTGILRWSTGSPFTVTSDPLACACLGVQSVPANFTSAAAAGVNGASSFNTSLFSTPAAGTFGSLSRNAFRGPDMFVYNAALFRNFAVRENVKLEFRGEAYNITNTTNLVNPIANAGTPGFGTSVGSLNGLAGRQFQVGARVLF
uniref:Cna B domain protein n=1 Tax=Solibacter usitatus (strain Ellin6076) TaxID=234267 RepID=Q022W3_SOLUE